MKNNKLESNHTKHEISPALFEDSEHEGPQPLEISSLAVLKRAIKPGTELMTTYHSKHPEIVGLVRVVTEVQTNAFYSVIKDQPDHKYSSSTCPRSLSGLSKRGLTENC